MRSTCILMTAAGMTMAMVAGFAVPAEAACTRLGFTVNDYGKDGPTRDAKSLLDKHIAKKMAERGVTKYNVGKKDVKCELFLDFVVFDEYTCTAEASVCWDEAAVTSPPAAEKAAAKEPSESKETAKSAESKETAKPSESKETAKSSESVSPAPEKKSEDTAAAPKAEEPASQPATESAADSKPSETPSESSSSAAVEPTSSAPQAEKSSESSPSETNNAVPEATAPAAKKSGAPVEVYERVTEPVPGIDTP